MLMNLWVRDKSTGWVHQVGTDSHDSLIFIDDKVEYYNLQNGCGTGSEDEYGYEFIDTPDMDNYVNVLPEEMYLNKALCDERIFEIIRNRPPEETEARGKYIEDCIQKAKELHKKTYI